MAKKKVVRGAAAAKKRSPKKAPKKTEAPAPVTPNAPIKPEDLTAFGFPIPRSLDAQEKRIHDLKSQGDEAQKHTGVLLTHMLLNQAHLSRGKDFGAYTEEVLGLSKGYVQNSINLVKAWHDMGAPPELFKRVGAGHIRELYRGFAKGALNRRDVRGLLPQATLGDPKYKSRDAMKRHVDAALGVTAGKTGTVLKTYALKPETGAAQELIESCIQSLKGHPVYKDFSQSQVLEKALVEFVANHGEEATPRFSWASLRTAFDVASALCPPGIAPVLLVTDHEKLETQILNDDAASKLIMNFFLGYAKGEPRIAVTPSAKRAAAILKCGEEQLRTHAYTVDPGVISRAAGRAFEHVVETVPVDPAASTVASEPQAGPEEPAPLDSRLRRLQEIKAKKAKKTVKAATKPKKTAKAEAPPEKPVEEEGEEEGEEEAPAPSTEKIPTDPAEVRELSKTILNDLRERGLVTRTDFAEKYNNLPGNLTDDEKYTEILRWALELKKKAKIA